MSKIRTKTVLVSLHISRWGNRKKDRKATARIAKESNAELSMVNTTKKLISPELLKPIELVYQDAIKYHYASTLAWSGKGIRAIPSKKLFDWITATKKLKGEFDTAVDYFIKIYSDKIEEAEKRLGDMFNKDDYPTAEEMRKKYSFTTTITPIPDTADFRIDLPEEELQEIRNQMDDSLVSATESAKRDLWGRINKTLEGLYETLIDEDKRIYGTTINSNIEVLLNQLHELNIDDDPHIKEMHVEISKRLKGLSKDELRSSKTYRDKAIKDADEIFSKMEKLMAN